MSRGRNYTQGKRARDASKAEKKRDKEERRWRKREQGPSQPDVVAGADHGEAPSVEELMANLSGGGGAARSAAPIPCKLFVGGLSWDTTSQGLEQAFAAYGQVDEAVIVQDRDTGQSWGFGFVTMSNRKDAPKAIDGLNDSELDGRRIVVNVAAERGR